MQTFQMGDFIFVQSVLHILHLDSFSALQDAKAALWLMEWPSPRELASCMQALPDAPAAERQKGRVSLFQ